MKPHVAPPQQRRWWWRWLRRLMLLGFLVMLLAAAGSYWAWRERVLVVNTLLLRLGGDLRVQFAALEWENGVLQLKEVSVTQVPTTKRLITAAEVEWLPRLGQLRSNNLGTVKIAGAVVELPFSLLAGTQGETSATASTWRLDALELDSTQVVMHDENHAPVLRGTVQASVRGGTTTGAFDSAKVVIENMVYQEKPILQKLQIEAAMQDDQVEIVQASLSGGQVDLAWLQNLKLPLRGGAQVDWEGRGLKFSTTGVVAAGTHELHLKDLRLQSMAEVGRAKAAALNFKVSQDAAGLWRVEQALLLSPVVEWTRELEEALLSQDESSSPGAWQVRVDDLAVKDGKVLLSKTARCPVVGTFDWSTKLQGLIISPAEVRSALPQRLEVAQMSLAWSGSDASVRQRPFAEMKSAVIEVVPDQLRERWKVQSLVLDAPRLELTPENGPWFDKIVSAPVKPPAKEPQPQPQPWQRLQFDTLTVKDGRVDLAMLLAERAQASMRFEVTTEQSKQHLRVNDARVSIPKRANLPVLSLEQVEAVTALPEMWRTRRVESLAVTGGQVEVGDALMTLFSGDAELVEEKLDVAAARWTAAKIDVKKLGVTLMSIAPGLPPVRFDVDFAAKETPLDLEGLAENVEPQRVELTHLRIPSPYEPLRTVAEMDVIQVNYTLDGLLHRRIDSVEIVSPLLYVGEDLFWYVETYRKIMKGETPTPDATLGPPAPSKPAAPGWHVDTLAVVDGRLLLAPKGVVMKGFGKPFPFSFTSKLESGQMEAVFDIPSDNYTLPDLKLEFRSMKGQVRFNLPMKDRNNNLTETFTVEQLRWKQLHIEKAHLSVTYDANGIYGSFGGEAYAGYVNGAFNIYLDDAYTWDGWVSGTDVNLGPVTTVLFPEYFLLDGVVVGKIVANGNMNELYQADTDFKNSSPGKFSIAALNDMIKTLPKALTGSLSDQITRIGLETLRDFEYDSVDSQARFYGREGRGHLRFTGPDGARNFDVNVYDHRWKEEPRRAASSNDE